MHCARRRFLVCRQASAQGQSLGRVWVLWSSGKLEDELSGQIGLESWIVMNKAGDERRVQASRGLAQSRVLDQRGFSLAEVSIVLALMILVSIMGIPAIQGYLIESKVPRVAEDLQRLVTRVKVSAISRGSTPYLNVGFQTLMNNLRNASAIQVTEGATAIPHGLGGTGASDSGVITMSPAASHGAVHGSVFSLVLNNVNHAACPALATILQRLASRVLITGRQATVEVKNTFISPPKEYDPILADAQCARGDSNKFEFVIH